MSQDNNNLFSAFKRPRETLGPNAFQSSLPQPSSVLKRSNSGAGSSRLSNIPAPRMSLAPPRATGSEFGLPSTVKRDSTKYSARKSYAPSSQPAPESTRRSSVFRRSSMGAGTFSQANSFFNSTATATIQRDPRPLKDRAYQAKTAQQIMEFLLQNDFEVQMKHSLTPNSLKSPTQKDFVMIFQWLYRRLDPNYRFQKSMDNEVMGILKFLRYPYANTITKSQLAAVGSANSWPLFLGMLHWLMELVRTADAFQSGEFDNAASEEGIDISSEKIIFKYVTRCYSSWLAGDDDHSAFEQEMAEAFAQKHSVYTTELEALEAENAALKKQLADLDESAAPLQKLEDARKVLEGDIKKFDAYIENVSQRSEKIRSTNDRVRAEIAAVEKELEEMEADKKELQAAVDRQGLTPQDIDRMNSEREKLSKGLQEYSQKLSETRLALTERETETQSKLESLERAVSRYNALGYQIGIIPISSPNSGGKEFELQILHLSEMSREGGKLLLDSVTGFQPAHLLNRDLRHDVKPALNRLRQEIGARIHAAQDETIKTQEYIDRISEALADKKEEIETLQAKVQSSNIEYNEIKDTMNAETAASNTEIEKFERDLRDLRVNMSNGSLLLEQKLQIVSIQYDQLKHASDTLREKLHSEVEKMLTEVIKFKVNIQKNLEEYETFVEDQLSGNDSLLEG